jgi:hypothetical protein
MASAMVKSAISSTFHMDDAQIRKKNDRNCWVWSLEIGFHAFSTECTVRQNHASPPNSMDDIKMIVISHTGLIVDSKFTAYLFSIYGLTIT